MNNNGTMPMALHGPVPAQLHVSVHHLVCQSGAQCTGQCLVASSPSCLPSPALISLLYLSLHFSSLLPFSTPLNSFSFLPLSLPFLSHALVEMSVFTLSLILSPVFLSVFLLTSPSFITLEKKGEDRGKWRRKKEGCLMYLIAEVEV